MKVLLDTNVILDVWLAREPWWPDAARLLAAVETGQVQGVVSPTTVTTLHYLANKVLGEQRARDLVRDLVGLCVTAQVSRETFMTALASGVRDFEDAVIEAVALGEGLDCIATRKTRDFRQSRVAAKEPAHVLSLIGAG